MILRNGYLGSVPHDASERGAAFAKLIRDARRRAGLTQREVVEGSGISKTTYVRWEGGYAERPDPDQVRQLCRFLRIDPRQAAVALGYLKPEDIAPGEESGRKLDPAILEVIEALEDPQLSDAEKRGWINYLRFLRQQAQIGNGDVQQVG